VTSDGRRLETRIVGAARDPALTQGGVNPVIQRASTILLAAAEDLYSPGVRTYGIHGTTTHDALTLALAEVEPAEHILLVGSGLMACTLPLLSLCQPGDHFLVTDAVYGPTRRFCERMLHRMGCRTEFFAPSTGEEISSLLQPRTRAIFLESPGSLTFEVSDTPAIAAIARRAGVTTIQDNTWGAGVFHRPLDLGVDISVSALTKYASGGADVLMGAIFTRREDLARTMRETLADIGSNVSPDDAYQVLRGLRSMPLRLSRHQDSALTVARWLQNRPEVAQVLYPALPEDPHHSLWRRDFSGAAGLFGVIFNPVADGPLHTFLNALRLFGLGFSWGGYESLIIPCDPQLHRTGWRPDGRLLRINIGLEAPEDLISDLDQAFARMNARRRLEDRRQSF
jgi:cystathionine beta-lyase